MSGPDEQVETHDGVPYRYSSAWTRRLESEDHWRYYWRQQKLLEGLVTPEDRLVEVGVGSGFTANYLRARGYNLVTVDIDAGKKPDVVANVAAWDFRVGANVLLAFEVFEHMPWVVFESALGRAVAAGVDRVFLSVPYCRREVLDIEWRSIFLRPLSLRWSWPRRQIDQGHHFWELGRGGMSRERLLALLAGHGFVLQREMEFRTLGFFAFDRRRSG